MKIKWQLLKLALFAVVVGGVVYQLKFSPIPVAAYTIERDAIVAEVMGTGTLEARVEATVSPKISGRIVEVFVDQGERVTAGELLVRLDDQELTQQVAIAQANVDAAAAGVTRLKIDKERAEAVYQQARRSYDRIQSLVEKNAASRDDADKATEALSVAQADIARAEAGIAEGQKEYIAAEKTAQYHSTRLRDTEIHAPFDGLIVRRNREPGDVVVPGSSIMTLISLDELWISAWVDETAMSKLKTEQTARVVFRSEPEQSYPGKVARLGREADRETREFIVDVRVLELPENWAVGQRAETFIDVAQRSDTLVLPEKLLVHRDGRFGVFTNDGGTAAWHELNLGVRGRDTVEVLQGVEEGDVIVSAVNPATGLSPGRRIAIRTDASR
ncbi:efflux RND transporter periplasmic adaptor subunit [Aporhodopirellula aestuarii]|uniref:Efflux RND transporter periplasmic adaptor subunit n=1 Tax=Aporhodopirellula aestuarii TaxID=2950107 RepID=A0ABT0U4H8_9BACT|nr:efflux RND transporter periplasmic adaptor subunit [Aporhodopirellula aestuarii]MCM2371455.1 efflux RND transporter periplasmic adaptor subunit [Aporhodopirellula aestuarii]